jgi:membrane-bound ClpP family serine protease
LVEELHFTMDNYGLFAVLLLLAGLVVLVTEVFIPSGGILAITTTVLLVSATLCAYAAWFRGTPGLFWAFVGGEIVLVPAALGTAFTILPKTAMGRRLILQAPELEEMEPFMAETARLQQLVGKTGMTATMLNPGGIVVVDQERLHAFSEGILIDPHTPVEILEVRGTRVLVRLYQGPLPDSGTSPGADAREPGGIDFELTPEV